MTRFKLFFRFEKEEKWLEAMAQQGWLLYRKSFFYRFQKVEPAARTIRMDYRTFRSSKDFADYCAMFEDSGWQHIAGTKSSGEQYFVKIGAHSTEDIFSDSLSRAGRYKRLAEMWGALPIAYIPILIALGRPDISYLLSPKQWYLTPGLWELEGISFWWSFLFETPFALLRGLGWLIPLCFLFICFGFAVASWRSYRSAEVHRKL